MKISDVLKSANSNIWHNKLRTTLTVGAIFVGALTLSLTTGAGAGMTEFLDTQVGNLGGKYSMIVMIKPDQTPTLNPDQPKPYKPNSRSGFMGGMGGRSPLSQVMSDDDLKKIQAIEGVVDIRPMKAVAVAYVGNGENKFDVNVREFDQDAKPNLSAGHSPDNKATAAQIELPAHYADALGFGTDAGAIGKTVQLGVRDLTGEVTEVPATVVGVTRKNFVGNALASINSPLLDKLYDLQREGMPDAFKNKYFIAKAHFDPTLSPLKVARMKRNLSDAGYLATTLEDQLGAIKQVINGVVDVFGVFALIALFAASFGVVNTLLMSVQERTKEIGLMKAMGMGSGKVFLLFSAEAVLLGFWGSFLGVVVAVLLGQLGNYLASKGPLKEMDGFHLFAFPIPTLLAIMGGIMTVTFIAGALPSLRASQLDPISALRYE